MTQGKLTKRQRTVLQGLKSDLGGKASTRELAILLHLNVNGLSQTLGALGGHKLVKQVGRNRGADTQWEALPDPAEATTQPELSPSEVPPPAA